MSAGAIPTTVENLITLDLSASYGALIIAAYLSCALWGINIMQAYMYYWSYPDDSWILKSVVAFLLVVDTAHKVLVTKVPWFTLIENWGRVSAVLASPEEALHEAWVGLIIVVIVQMYYLRRIALFALNTRFARNWWLWTALIVLALASLLQIPETIAYLAFSINRANIFIPINLRLKTTGLVSAVVVDSAIAVAMIVLLKDADSIDGQMYTSKRTARTIRRLTVITVNTGLITAIISILSLVLDLTASSQIFWTAIPQYPTCSIYLSAFLANLNARHYIRGEHEIPTLSNLEDLRFASAPSSSGFRNATGSMATRTESHFMHRQPYSETHSSKPESAAVVAEDHIVVNFDKYTYASRETPDLVVKVEKSVNCIESEGVHMA